jgi:phosphoserine phosphatase
VLLTGTLDPIAQALARRLGVRNVCATVCRQRNGKYLSQPPETHPFGSAKISLSRQIATQLGGDIGSATAYGNSRHDLQLLEAVQKAVAVLPDSVLRKAAHTRDWETIDARLSPLKSLNPDGSPDK